MTMVLIVEDEKKLAELLRDYLVQSNFETKVIDNGLEVVPYVRENKPDLILLDLMLPGLGIFLALLGIFKKDEIVISNGGLRYGAALRPEFVVSC